MKIKVKIILVELLVALLAILDSTAFAQGTLTPPGAPAATMKTLDQVEARIPVDAVHTPGDSTAIFIISQPGSYYLTTNLTGVTGKKGILITSSHVTLDLNGFFLYGSNVAQQCILISSVSLNDIEVRNGTIANWASTGVFLGTTSRVRVFNLRVADCTGDGIAIGASSEVRGCMVQGCGGSGILLNSSGSTVSDNVLIVNATGVSAGTSGNLIIRNTFRGDTTTLNLVAGNSAGPLVTSANIASSTNPAANFTP